MTNTHKVRVEVKAFIPERIKRTIPLSEDAKEIIRESYISGHTHANTEFLKEPIIYNDTDSVTDMKLHLASPYGKMLGGNHA